LLFLRRHFLFMPQCLLFCAAAFFLGAVVFALCALAFVHWGSICSLCHVVCLCAAAFAASLCRGIASWVCCVGVSLCCSVCSIVMPWHCNLICNIAHQFAMLCVDSQCCALICNVVHQFATLCIDSWCCTSICNVACQVTTLQIDLQCCALICNIAHWFATLHVVPQLFVQHSWALCNILGHCATFRGIAQHSRALHNLLGCCATFCGVGQHSRHCATFQDFAHQKGGGGFMHQEMGVHTSGKGGLCIRKGGLCVRKGASRVMHSAGIYIRPHVSIICATLCGKKIQCCKLQQQVLWGEGVKNTINLCYVSSGVVALVCRTLAYLCSCNSTGSDLCNFVAKNTAAAIKNKKTTINLCNVSSRCWVEALLCSQGQSFNCSAFVVAASSSSILLLVFAGGWVLLLLSAANYVITTVVVDSGSTIVGVIGTAFVSSHV